MTIDAGWYKLTADLENPSPDRRMKRLASKPIWKAGLVVYVKTGNTMVIEFSDGSFVHYGNLSTDLDWNKNFCQGNVILENIVPATVTVGRMFRKAWATPEQLLAALVEFDGVTMERLDALDKQLSDMNEDDFEEWGRKHNVVFISSE